MENQPKHYQRVTEEFADYIKAVENLGKTCKSSGVIDEKYALLIQLAAAAAIRSEGSVHSHTRRLLEFGVEKDEIIHSILLLTCIIGFPNTMAALSWVYDIIDE